MTSEDFLTVGIAFLLLTTVTLGGGLLMVRLMKKRTDTNTLTRMLRATLLATLLGILLALAPLPRLDFKPVTFSTSSPYAATQKRNVTSAPTGSAQPIAATSSPSQPSQPSLPFPAILVLAWLLGTVLLLVRLLAGCGFVARLGKYAPVISPYSPLGGSYWKAFATAQRQPTKIVSVESADLFLVDLPFLPVFLALPQDANTRFDPSTLNAILAHERSHLERCDGRWNLAAQILCCFLWFQPLSWLLLQAMERNSEAACDESALASSDCTARDYAEMLLRFAEFPQRQHPLLQSLRGITPLLTRSTLEERIYTLMTRSHKTTPPPASPRLQATIFGGLALLTLLCVVTFGPRKPVTATQPPQGITYEALDTDTIDALHQILSQGGMQLAEGDEKVLADAAKQVTFKATDQTFTNLLGIFLKVISSKNKWYLYEINGKTVHITSIPLDKNNLPVKRITMEYGPGPLRGALDEMLRGTGFEVIVWENIRIGKRLKYQNALLSEAIPALLQSYPETLSWDVDRGQLTVQTLAAVQKQQESYQKKAEELLTTVPVTLDFKNTPLRQAVEELFKAIRTDYSIDVGVKGSVTLSIKNRTAIEALTELLKQAETPTEYAIENGVIFVKTKQ